MLLSKTWRINHAIHLVRGQTYRGKKVDRADLPVKLRYDGMTMLGMLFCVSRTELTCTYMTKTFCALTSGMQPQVGSTLQVRGCQLNMQQAMLNCLETFLGNLGLLDFEIPLLPEVPDCAWAVSCFAATHDMNIFCCYPQGRLLFNGPDAHLESLTEFLSYVGMTSRPDASSQRIRRIVTTLASQVEANESLQPSREEPHNRTRILRRFLTAQPW